MPVSNTQCLDGLEETLGGVHSQFNERFSSIGHMVTEAVSKGMEQLKQAISGGNQGGQ